jgi:hypothetical protein
MTDVERVRIGVLSGEKTKKFQSFQIMLFWTAYRFRIVRWTWSVAIHAEHEKCVRNFAKQSETGSRGNVR